MRIDPLQDRVLVKRIEAEDVKKSGIIIPETAKEKPQRGKVVAVGKGKLLENGQRRALDVKEGNEVLFGKYSGTEINIDDDEYLIMSETEILGIIEC